MHKTIMKKYLRYISGAGSLEDEVASLKMQLTHLRQIQSLTSKQNKLFHLALVEIRKHEQRTLRDVNKSWYGGGFSSWSFLMAEMALKGVEKTRRLSRLIDSSDKHRARDMVNAVDLVLTDRLSLKKAKRVVLNKRGESYRRFKWREASAPYLKKQKCSKQEA